MLHQSCDERKEKKQRRKESEGVGQEKATKKLLTLHTRNVIPFDGAWRSRAAWKSGLLKALKDLGAIRKNGKVNFETLFLNVAPVAFFAREIFIVTALQTRVADASVGAHFLSLAFFWDTNKSIKSQYICYTTPVSGPRCVRAIIITLI